MFNRIHQKLGTAGFIISIVALVAALSGGAYAASGGLSGKQKKEVEKIAKKYAGKPGTAGAAGPAGPAGAKGDAGAAGGSGANGISPVGTKFKGAKAGSGCSEGGVEFKGANTTYACNGAQGTTGFTEFLPSEETLEGAWSVSKPEAEASLPILSSISFGIPLEAAPEFNFVTAANASEPAIEESCPGTAAEPKAAAGQLCVYAIAGFTEEAPSPEISAAGVTMFFPVPGAGGFFEYGTWAVTAE